MITSAANDQTGAAENFKSHASAKRFPQESLHIIPQVAPGSASPPENETTITTLPLLFQPFTDEDLTIANSLVDGFMTDYRLVHLGSFALYGNGLSIAEAAAVEARDRISPACASIYSDNHIPSIKRVVEFASSILWHTPEVFGPEEYWRDNLIAPSEGPQFQKDKWGRCIPRALSIDEIQDVVRAFGAAVIRADKARMDTVEIQGSYEYLIHNFLSPITNHCTDEYGGTLESRARLLLEVVKEQVPYAARVRKEAPDLPVVTVGNITPGKQAQEVVESGQVDLVAAARSFLKNPTFALDAGRELGVNFILAPQYFLAL
ncbi:hypothetical protein BGW39_002892 [Mortierella sp. 14UC]|nr:hypothetical protein BGW39_002892 [Mortierella sp. 14UC]